MDATHEHPYAMDEEYAIVEEEIEEEEEVEEEVELEEDGTGGGGSGREGGGQGLGRREAFPAEREIDEGNNIIDSLGQETKQIDGGFSSAGKIFVGGVAWDTTEETFAQHFRKYGKIVDSVIMKDRHTQMPRGFGFVTFADPSVIDRLLEEEHFIDGRTVEVKRTVPREDMPSRSGLRTRKIFVGGILPTLTEDELKEHFSSYGQVVEHQIMFDHNTGRSRGFGFVTFEDEDSVDKLISEGKMHFLGGKQVEIKRAEPKRATGDSGTGGRTSHGTRAGNSRGYRGGSYGNEGGYRSGDAAYYGESVGYGYGRGNGGYGGFPSYGAGLGAADYGIYGGAGYLAGNAYASGYSGLYGAYSNSYGSAHSYGGRYHPYGK